MRSVPFITIIRICENVSHLTISDFVIWTWPQNSVGSYSFWNIARSIIKKISILFR